MLAEYIDKYLENSKDTKMMGTYKGEITIAQSLKRCLSELNIKAIDEIRYESYLDIVKYYKVYTRCKNSSINKHVAYLKAVLRFYGYHAHPFLLAKKLKDDTTHTKRISKDNLYQIMAYVAHLNKSRNSIVYRAVVFFLFETGARIGELLDIKIKNVNLSERSILLDRTKNHRNRVVPYSHLGASVIRDLIKLNPSSEYLFWNLIRNRKLEYNDVKLFLRDMMKDLAIDHVHPHMFRKTMATSLVERGARMKTVQTILGHESISTTEIYTDYGFNVAILDYQKRDISKRVVSAIENHVDG